MKTREEIEKTIKAECEKHELSIGGGYPGGFYNGAIYVLNNLVSLLGIDKDSTKHHVLKQFGVDLKPLLHPDTINAIYAAMQAYADQFHSPSAGEDAVEFAEWISENVEAHYFVNGAAQYVLPDQPGLHTTQQLYNLFRQQQPTIKENPPVIQQPVKVHEVVADFSEDFDRMLEERDREILRLKGLIRREYEKRLSALQYPKETLDNLWHHFETENQL